MRYTSYLKYLLFLACYFLSLDAFAGVFDVGVTDKSREYLSIIFGGNVGAITLGNSGNPLLSKMFERFNFIIVTFGVLVLSYIGVVAAINTAREGEAMGKKFSLWVPLRSLFGMLMMLPSPGTGYSIVQMTVMWIVLNGIGAANAVWNVVLDQLAAGVKVVGQPDVDIQEQINNLTHSILQISVCQNFLNRPDLDLKSIRYNGKVTVNFPTNPISPLTKTEADNDLRDPITKQIIVKKGGVQSYTASGHINVGNSEYDKACGSIEVKVVVDYKDPNFSEATAVKYFQIKVAAIKSIFDEVQSPAVTLAAPKATFDASPQLPPGTFLSAYKNYMAIITQLITTPRADNAEKVYVLNALKLFGWIHAGGYYYTLTQGSKFNTENVTIIPTPSDEPTYSKNFKYVMNPDPNPQDNSTFSGNLETMLANNLNRRDLNTSLGRVEAFSDKDQQATAGLPVLGSGYPSTGHKIIDKIISKTLSGIRTPIFKFFSSSLTEKGEDPLISIGTFGTRLMLASEMTSALVIITSFLTLVSTASGSCLSPFAWAFNNLLFTVLPFVAGILVLLWATGATLGVYIPMVPYLVFTATAMGWMLAVIEAVVGAPIIALGLVQPSGEELGKIAPALGILANIFLRPTLMIFGFVIAGSLLRAILVMINFGFLGALNTAIPYPSIFSIVPVLALYMALIIAVVNQAFSLIYELPNKVLRFMGVAPEGGSPEKVMSETKAGADKGAEGAQSFQKGQVGAARKKIQEKKAAHEEKNKGDGGALPKPKE